ncbi:MAG: helix-turn-helix transcriptional regulator [Bryobacteraceae bacterium]
MISPVKIIRQRLLMTQAEFAKKLGMSKQMISNYENDLYSPSMTTIKKLMQIAGENNIEVGVGDFFKE